MTEIRFGAFRVLVSGQLVVAAALFVLALGPDRVVYVRDLLLPMVLLATVATIIASHIRRKLAADAAQVWPGIRIHIMDIVQPPGISISQHIERQK